MIGEILKIGDRVTINIPDENWDWGYRPVEKQNGTEAEVVGFSEIHYSRIRSYGKKPGVYVNRCWTKVRLDSGKEYMEFTGRLELVDRKEYEKRISIWKKEDHKNNGEFLGDLPNTSFWEGDKILVSGTGDDVQELIVVGIEYGWKEERTSWVYRVSDKFSSGWHTYARENEMELIERGNVWNFYHDEPLQFGGINEEAQFFVMLGHCEYVRNPATNLYRWSKDEVLEAIKKGIVDGFSMGVIPFSFGEKSIEAIRFNDRNLGKRVREATLKGFGWE